MNGPIFLDSCVKGPVFLTSWYMHIFFVQRFFEAAYPLGITWIDCDICVITSKKWVQQVKGQYMNRSIFWMIKYMNGSVFSKARYMNGVGFEILARTPVPKLPLSYTPSPPPHTPRYIMSRRPVIKQYFHFFFHYATFYRYVNVMILFWHACDFFNSFLSYLFFFSLYQL